MTYIKTLYRTGKTVSPKVIEDEVAEIMKTAPAGHVVKQLELPIGSVELYLEEVEGE